MGRCWEGVVKLFFSFIRELRLLERGVVGGGVVGVGLFLGGVLGIGKKSFVGGVWWLFIFVLLFWSCYLWLVGCWYRIKYG